MQQLVVYQIKDTIFWKQITTLQRSNFEFVSCLSDQRYNFLKANHNSTMDCPWYRCCLSDQRYNFLKANHNGYSRCYRYVYVVYQIKDTIFWKQITTFSGYVLFAVLLFIRSKIQFFESKSQPSLLLKLTSPSCLSDQRYNFLKANHNPYLTDFIGNFCCLSDQRYNFLKANHNYFGYDRMDKNVVYQIKDTIFWKQITTRVLLFDFVNKLFIRSKIQFFESKSQLIQIMIS